MACVRKRRGKWVVDWRDQLGVRRWLSFETKREAEDELAVKIKESRQGAMRPVVDRDITLDAYADVWLARIKATVEQKTLASYAQLLRLHVRPAFGPTKMRLIHRGHIKAFLAAKMSEEVTTQDGSTRRRLGKNSMRLIRATLSVLFGDAVEDGLLTVNPAIGIKRRGRRQADAVNPAEQIRPLGHEQLAVFLAQVNKLVSQETLHRGTGRFFYTLADAGLRPGEGLALRWPDFDPVARTLKVERAVSAGQVKLTKTGTTRTVDLTVRLTETLSGWQARCEADALLAGVNASPWMFPSETGTPLDEARVSKRYRMVLQRANLPRFRLYDLRHSFATHLLEAGAPITYVAAQLGHSNPATTLRHYAHWIPRGDKAWIDRLAEVRNQASGSKTVAVAEVKRASDV
jgi:integrase